MNQQIPWRKGAINWLAASWATELNRHCFEKLVIYLGFFTYTVLWTIWGLIQILIFLLFDKDKNSDAQIPTFLTWIQPPNCPITLLSWIFYKGCSLVLDACVLLFVVDCCRSFPSFANQYSFNPSSSLTQKKGSPILCFPAPRHTVVLKLWFLHLMELGSSTTSPSCKGAYVPLPYVAARWSQLVPDLHLLLSRHKIEICVEFPGPRKPYSHPLPCLPISLPPQNTSASSIYCSAIPYSPGLCRI